MVWCFMLYRYIFFWVVRLVLLCWMVDCGLVIDWCLEWGCWFNFWRCCCGWLFGSCGWKLMLCFVLVCLNFWLVVVRWWFGCGCWVYSGLCCWFLLVFWLWWWNCCCWGWCVSWKWWFVVCWGWSGIWWGYVFLIGVLFLDGLYWRVFCCWVIKGRFCFSLDVVVGEIGVFVWSVWLCFVGFFWNMIGCWGCWLMIVVFDLCFGLGWLCCVVCFFGCVCGWYWFGWIFGMIWVVLGGLWWVGWWWLDRCVVK